MKRNWMSLVIVIFIVAAATLSVIASGTPDRELSLSKTSVFEVPQPPAEKRNVSEPGERPTLPSDFPEQPMLVPHGIVDWLPITMTENQCIDCHAVQEKLEGEPTPIPRSHFIDLRNAPNTVRDEVVGARYNCLACHAAPGSNELLVRNDFVPGH